MSLDILISTFDSGIYKIKDILLPPRLDVRYIVSHQYTNDNFKIIPEELKRNDVFIYHLSGKGLTISRNNAINFAEGNICLIADDDVKYNNQYLDSIINVFNDKTIDVACFKIKTPNGESEYKDYPEQRMKLITISIYSPSSIEIVFRTEEVKLKNIQFDSRFGLGSPLPGGEETLFIADCIRSGLNVFFVPIYVVEHPFESSTKSLSKFDKRRNRVSGAIDYRLNGKISFLRSVIVSLKLIPELIKNKKNPFNYLLERISGSLYILKTERERKKQLNY